jgi:hypothetical protein
VAVLSLGAVLSVKVDTSRSVGLALAVLIAFVPSLYYAIRAVMTAVKVREPQGAATFPSVKFAVEMAEHHKVKEKLEVNLWLIFGPLCEAILRRNEKKAHYAKESHRFYVSCLKWTALPVGVIIAVLIFMLIFPPPVPAPPTSVQTTASTSPPPSGSWEARPSASGQSQPSRFRPFGCSCPSITWRRMAVAFGSWEASAGFVVCGVAAVGGGPTGFCWSGVGLSAITSSPSCRQFG